MPQQAERPLTEGQRDVLAVVEHAGPVTPNDVGEYHLPIGIGAARSRLATLERRGLVAATYTGHHRGRGRAYQITTTGSAVLEAEEG